MQAAIAITRWFVHETTRIYATFSENEKDREERLILEWVQRRGGRATARDVARSLKAIESSDAADLAMGRLVAAGFARWESIQPGPQGGRPSRDFVLTDLPPPTKPRETAEKASFVGEEMEEVVI
jgi:predicted ArsR family transcriptional regulator